MRMKFLLALLAFATLSFSLRFGPASFGSGEPQSAEAALLGLSIAALLNCRTRVKGEVI